MIWAVWSGDGNRLCGEGLAFAREFFALARFDIGRPESCIFVTSRAYEMSCLREWVAFPWDVWGDLTDAWSGLGGRRDGHEQHVGLHIVVVRGLLTAMRGGNGSANQCDIWKAFSRAAGSDFRFWSHQVSGDLTGRDNSTHEKTRTKITKAEKKGPWWYG